MKSSIFSLTTLISIFSSLDGRVLPFQSNQTDSDPSLLRNPNLSEGDIIDARINEKYRSLTLYHTQLWPNAKIIYVIDASLSEISWLIHNVMRHIENHTCIRFKKRSTEKDYVKYFNGNGCFSATGRIGQRQTISIGNGCANFGIILHETLHTLGFLHTHSRYDRDQHLNICYKNIKPEFIKQFDIVTSDTGLAFGAFDYDSIMMYGPYAASKSKNVVTMWPKDSSRVLVDIYDKYGLSSLDIKAINSLYLCDTYL